MTCENGISDFTLGSQLSLSSAVVSASPFRSLLLSSSSQRDAAATCNGVGRGHQNLGQQPVWIERDRRQHRIELLDIEFYRLGLGNRRGLRLGIGRRRQRHRERRHENYAPEKIARHLRAVLKVGVRARRFS